MCVLNIKDGPFCAVCSLWVIMAAPMHTELSYGICAAVTKPYSTEEYYRSFVLKACSASSRVQTPGLEMLTARFTF